MEYSIWMDRGFWALVSTWFVVFTLLWVALMTGQKGVSDG